MSITVDLKILDARLHHMMPAYATTGSAGLDLRACIEHTLTIPPGETVIQTTKAPRGAKNDAIKS